MQMNYNSNNKQSCTKSLLLITLLLSFLSHTHAAYNASGNIFKYRVNLTEGSSCVHNQHCASGCCDLGFDSDETLGTYCFWEGYCTSEKKNPGQSCGISNDCFSNCCEDTICQKNSICFNKYVLPFVIVFGVLVIFLVAAVVILVLYKRKMRRQKMMKRMDDKAKRMLTNMGIKLPEKTK